MEFLVDFNMVEADGRIPALVSPARAAALRPGTKVLAFDGEGTGCQAVIDELSPDGRYVLLMPVEGTVRPSILHPTAGS